jgi:hypothetical protein
VFVLKRKGNVQHLRLIAPGLSQEATGTTSPSAPVGVTLQTAGMADFGSIAACRSGRYGSLFCKMR